MEYEIPQFWRQRNWGLNSQTPNYWGLKGGKGVAFLVAFPIRIEVFPSLFGTIGSGK